MQRIAMSVAFIAAVLVGLGDAGAAGEPSSNASCLGIGSSAVAPLGLRDMVAHNTKAFAELTGVTPGYLVTTASLEHAGSFAACFGP